MRPIRVLAVASEIYPLVKTGGLADVAGALPLALTSEGVETATLVPVILPPAEDKLLRPIIEGRKERRDSKDNGGTYSSQLLNPR